MKRLVPIVALVGFVGFGPAWAASGGADRLRNPNGRGMGVSEQQYRQDMKKKRSQNPNTQYGAPMQH